MKRLTIKLKITLWFTIFMIILCAVVLLFIAVISDSTAARDIRISLTGLVDRNVREIERDDGRPEIDDDFIYFQEGMYCLLFNEDGGKLNGYAPYDELEKEPFEDKSIRAIQIDGETYLVYDRLVVIRRGGDVWIRGIVSDKGGLVSLTAVYRAALIALPLLIILAAVGGYMIAKRSLLPIQKINKTADEIGGSGDLSKRIEMGNGDDELHQLADTFNKMFGRLEENFEAEKHFTSDASHELRTPVSVILAQCEYAFENASGEHELYEAIGAIQKQGYRMSHLIESLLYFTRIEQHTESLSFETVDISALVRSVCQEQKELKEKNISLLEDVQTGIAMKADTALFSRMLVNLIRNAYRYGRENGNINVNFTENNSEILLYVADDGIGIAPEDLPKIWNRFYRADKSRSSARGAGLGLGLAMVKQIAELHNGVIYVESELDKGSTFTVKFPKK